MPNSLYFIVPLLILLAAWPIIYLIKYGGMRGGFERTSDEECSQGIYTSYKNCSTLQKIGRGLWDTYSTIVILVFFMSASLGSLSLMAAGGSF